MNDKPTCNSCFFKVRLPCSSDTCCIKTRFTVLFFFFLRGIHLIETNEEVCVFYEKLNIQGENVFIYILTSHAL